MDWNTVLTTGQCTMLFFLFFRSAKNEIRIEKLENK